MIQAALAGDCHAQYLLGACLKRGRGIPQDFVAAAEWLAKAAEAGSGRAQIDLGVSYYYGQGVPRDHHKSMQWHYAGLCQGRILGAHNIGELYEDSDVIPRYLMEAMAWYTMSAKDYIGSQERIDAMLPFFCEEDVIRAGTRAEEIFEYVIRGAPLHECIAHGKATHVNHRGPQASESPTTRLTLFLAFHAASKSPTSEYLLMRELIGGESILYVKGWVPEAQEYVEDNEISRALGQIPAVGLDCVITLNGERCIDAYSAVQHLAAAHPEPDLRPVAFQAKKVRELMHGLRAKAVHIDRGRPSEFNYHERELEDYE